MVQPLLSSDFPGADERTVRILARSLFRDLQGGGLSQKEIVAVVNELLGLIIDDVKAPESGARER